MLNLVPSHIPGAGLRSGARALGTRWLFLGLIGLTVSGCATKGDVRNLQDEIRALAAQQRQTLEELSGLNLAVQDTLGRQSDAIFESRGDINRRLQGLDQELLTIQELLRMNQQSLMTIRDLLESQRSGGVSTMRTDTEPGQSMEVGFVRSEDRAGGPVEMYNTASPTSTTGPRTRPGGRSSSSFESIRATRWPLTPTITWLTFWSRRIDSRKPSRRSS